MSKIDIIPVEYGKSVLGADMVFSGGNREEKLPIVFMVYLLKAENRLILVDAGCETMPGFDMRDFIGPVKALKSVGINPEDIDDVIITHSHHDHIESVNYYKNAVIHIQRDEYELGKNYFSEEANIKLFNDSAEIIPGVTAVKIAGHSCGSCVVEVEDNGKKYVIAGDELYTKRNVEEKLLSGSVYSTENNKKFIEKYCTGDYTVLLCHDK